MSNPKLFDVHTHIQFAAFKDDAGMVIQRALDQGMWLVNVGTQKDTSQGAVTLAEKFDEGVYATVGLHPIHTKESYHDRKELGGNNTFVSRGEEFVHEYYKNLATHKKVVAIGECGLDYYRLEPETKKKQENIFLEQIGLSSEVKKPLMIHCRQAFEDLIAILEANRTSLVSMPGIVHFFSGTVENAKKLLDLGFSFSFGGVITFAREYDDVVRYIPLDKIMLETDAPYVSPKPYRGRRNEPVYIVEVAKKLAELKNISIDEVAKTTFTNAQEVFSI